MPSQPRLTLSEHPLFHITPEHISRLDADSLELLIARLCKAELRRRGLLTDVLLRERDEGRECVEGGHRVSRLGEGQRIATEAAAGVENVT